MQENFRKIVATAGCPILAVPLFLRQGWETTKASPVLAFARAALPSPKRREKCRKSAQKHIGNHPTTPTKSRT